MKKEILKRLIPTIIFLAILSLLHWQAKWQLIGLWAGGLIGTFLLDLDNLIYCFFQNPHELTLKQREKDLFSIPFFSKLFY
jgi:hypothetical protein